MAKQHIYAKIDDVEILKYYNRIGIKPTIDDVFTFTVNPSNDNTVSISAKGNPVGELVIPYKTIIDGVEYIVTTIDSNAFADNTDLTSVIIPNTVKTIDNTAFNGCTNLTNIFRANTIGMATINNGEIFNDYINNKASYGSHAEGERTTAIGQYSHTEGSYTKTFGDYSHAEGKSTYAKGEASHTEGYGTKAEGDNSHAEGDNTIASNQDAHAEGYSTAALSLASHAEGAVTTASGNHSHAEGYFTTASGTDSHAEGIETTASGGASHAEGCGTTASGSHSHAEGYNTTASGFASHAEGYFTTALAHGCSAKGKKTTAGCRGYWYSLVENNDSGSIITLTATHDNSTHWHDDDQCEYLPGDSVSIIAGGKYYNCANIVAIDNNKIYLDKNLGKELEGKPNYEYDAGFDGNIVFVLSKPEIGYVDLGIAATSEGGIVKDDETTAALGPFSHVEGRNNQAIGHYSHAEGRNNEASNVCAHVEGQNNKAIGELSHAEGAYTEAKGNKSHAEGNSTIASGATSHAEGNDTEASGTGSHAEGWLTVASGEYSHSEGLQTTASGDYSHVQGKYNIEDKENKYAHIVGNGIKNGNKTTLSNAHTLDWNGNAWFAGTVETSAIILRSPNGNKFKITVSDTGDLNATPCTEDK